jgi:hypothetical protein
MVDEHTHVMFQTTDVKTYKADSTVIRLSARGPRGALRDAEFLTREQARALIEQLETALGAQEERK